jgi:hypothetical protein
MGRLIRGMAALAAGVAIAGGSSPSMAQAPGGPAKPPVDIRFEIDPLVECHFFLKSWAGPSEPSIPGEDGDLGSEASAYTKAQESLRDQAAWRWFEDLVVTGPDPGRIREAARTLPSAFDTPANRTSVDMLVEALASAYPKFVKAYWPNHSQSLNRTLIDARKRYARVSQEIESTLMEKMAFQPVHAPIRVIGVIRAGPVSSWGKARGSYYTVIGTYMQSSDSFAETAVHEATHLIDSVQSQAGRWMLRDVRLAITKDAPPEAVDTFIHGLVAFNAGQLITRFMNKTYKPVGLLGPGSKETYAPYVPAYEGAWIAWLDGTKSRDETIAKLASGFRDALAAKPGSTTPAPPAKPSLPVKKG